MQEVRTKDKEIENMKINQKEEREEFGKKVSEHEIELKKVWIEH